jgi:hypothetical protein
MDDDSFFEEQKTLDDIDQTIEVGLEGLAINIRSSLYTVKFLLLVLVVLGIISLVHFW